MRRRGRRPALFEPAAHTMRHVVMQIHIDHAPHSKWLAKTRIAHPANAYPNMGKWLAKTRIAHPANAYPNMDKWLAKTRIAHPAKCIPEYEVHPLMQVRGHVIAFERSAVPGDEVGRRVRPRWKLHIVCGIATTSHLTRTYARTNDKNTHTRGGATHRAVAHVSKHAPPDTHRASTHKRQKHTNAWRFVYMTKLRKANTNTEYTSKYTCGACQTRNKLLDEQCVHLTREQHARRKHEPTCSCSA